MPMAVKQLHMANDIIELKKLSKVEAIKLNRPVEKQMFSFNKLYESAIEQLNKPEKDDELIFIYLFRSMEVWTMVRESSEFKSDPKFYTLMHGKTIQKVVELLEIQEEKLVKRYSEKKSGSSKGKDNIKDQFHLSNIVISKKKAGKENKGIKTVNGFLNHVLPPENNSANQIVKPDFLETSIEEGYIETKKFIQCQELMEHVKSRHKILVIDIRPKKDFDQSKIINVDSVNIPGTSIVCGMSADKVGGLVESGEQKFYWNHRDQYEQLVLLDWHSEEKDVIPTSPLDALLNILLKWDPDVIYKNKPLILNGGYEGFLDVYPTFTTNARITCPQKPVSNPFMPGELNIDYPMNIVEDLVPPKLIPLPKSTEILPPRPAGTKPTINRTTKPELSVGKPELTIPEAGKVRSPPSEPMDEDKEYFAKDVQNPVESLSVAAPKDRSADSSPEPHHTRPTTPPRQDKTYPSTPKKPVDKGDGDGIILERLKHGGGVSRSGGLKRSASSPHLNKPTEEDLDASTSMFLPKFDRSTKPKQSPNYDSYSPRGAGTDTVYQANKQVRGLTGLKNLGNLCYMNSIMQCLSNTVELNNDLTRFNLEERNNQQIASEVSSLLRVLWQGDTRLTSCRGLKLKVGALRQSFSTYEQQDSHEFLTLLMDWLHEDLNEPSMIRTLDGADEATGEKAWGQFKAKNNSVVLDLFYGQLKSTVTCNHCQKQSVLFEPFSNLSIPLPPPQETPYDMDRGCSLQECLKLYLKGENISGWVCPSCKTAREATKKLDITRLPPVLIIHLKRFMTDMVGVGWCRKRMNMVEFPINDLDMKPYTHVGSELRYHNYNLYAVSNHYGSMDSGHYTAYCKNHLLNKWYKFDDHDVNEMSPADVRSTAAYILFYETSHMENTRIAA